MFCLFYIIIFQRILCQNCFCDELFPIHNNMKNGEFMDRLFDGYTKNMLPVLNIGQPVLLNISLLHMSIENLDIKQKILSARVVASLSWTDEHLTWDSSSFRNLSRVFVEPKSIWLPDLFLGNKEGLLTFLKPENVQIVTVNNNGVVKAWPYLDVDVGVDLNIHKYPFDIQVCVFEFASWTHNDRELNILELQDDEESNDSLQQFRQNGEWDLIKWERNRLIITYDNYNYTVIQYKFTVRRRWLYTILNLVAPVVLTSFLNPLSFLLPVDSGERISLSNTVFLTLAVFFSIVNNSLPKTSEGIPITVAYIGLQMLGSALTIICTILSLALYHNRQDISKSKILEFILRNREKQKKAERNVVMDTDEVKMIEKEEQENERKEVWMTVSNYLDKLCFWLSLGWNIALFSIVVVEANSQ